MKETLETYKVAGGKIDMCLAVTDDGAEAHPTKAFFNGTVIAVHLAQRMVDQQAYAKRSTVLV